MYAFKRMYFVNKISYELDHATLHLVGNTLSFILQYVAQSNVIQTLHSKEIFVASRMINGLILPVIKERQNKQGKQKLYEVVELSFVIKLTQTTKE